MVQYSVFDLAYAPLYLKKAFLMFPALELFLWQSAEESKALISLIASSK